jgi:hypothetical protein
MAQILSVFPLAQTINSEIYIPMEEEEEEDEAIVLFKTEAATRFNQGKGKSLEYWLVSICPNV